MVKNKRKNTLIVIGVAVIFIFSVGTAYFLGSHNQAGQITALRDEQILRDQRYARSLETVSDERNRALNDYDAACTEYQKLYAAYDTLYALHIPVDATQRYTSPDAARGNEDSCYR